MSELDLFNGEHTMTAMKSLSPEDVARYKEIGKQMYGSVNFTDSKVLNSLPAPMYEAMAYIHEQIKSGMHISMLEDNEKAIMVDAYGDNWYEKYGYVKSDLEDIVTVKPVPPVDWEPKKNKQ